MKKLSIRFVMLGVASALLSTVGLAQTTSKATGHWQGKIQIPEHELAITVDLAQNPKGAWIGSMTLPGTSSLDVPLNAVTVDDAAVRFTANLPERAVFSGRLSADAATLSGTATNAQGEAPFQLTRGGEANVKLPPPSSALSKEFEGRWEGVIDSGGKVRRVALKLAAAPDGTATAILISVDKNLEIPVTTVTVKGKELQLEARVVSGTYRGVLGESGEISGEWMEGANRIPLTFKHVAAEAK